MIGFRRSAWLWQITLLFTVAAAQTTKKSPPIIVERFEPQSVNMGEGATVTVFGENFRDKPNMGCKFGEDVVIRGVFISSNEIECDVPTSEAREFDLAVTNFGRNFYDVGVIAVKEVETQDEGGSWLNFSFGSEDAEQQDTTDGADLAENVTEPAAQVDDPVVPDGCRLNPSGELECGVGMTGGGDDEAPADSIRDAQDSSSFHETTDSYQREERAQVAGSLSGGILVDIRGIGFPPGSEDVSCRFGEEVTNGVASDDLVQCLLPSVDHPGPVPVAVSFDGNKFIETQLYFYFKESATIAGAYPLVGPTSGGTRIVISGGGFTSWDDFKCAFGSKTTPTEFISETEVHCVSAQSPSSEEGTVNFQVLDDNNDVIAAFEYSYKAVPIVESVSPSTSSKTGNIVVTAQGRNFQPEDGLSCRFGDEVVEGRFIRDSMVTCIAPPSRSGVVNFSVSNNGETFSSEEVQFSFSGHARVLSLQPHLGSSSGNTMITISGSDFPGEEGKTLCRFGKTTTLGTQINHDTVRCLSPPASSIQNAPVEISFDEGATFTEDEVPFRYLAPSIVLDVEPQRGPASGGNIITLHGANFHVGLPMQCKFGDTDPVDARVLNSNTLLCEAPKVPDAVEVPIEVTFNQVDYTSDNTTYHYLGKDLIDPDVIGLTATLDVARIVSIVPDNAPEKSRGQVTLHGKHFQKGEIYCLFDKSRSSGKWISSEKVTCTIPHHKPGEVVIEMTSNGIDFTNDNHTFLFTDSASVQSIDPHFGPKHGGPLVTVSGTRFETTGVAYTCMFGKYSSPATVVSEEKMTCVVPRSTTSATVKMDILANGLSFLDYDLSFKFQDPIKIQSIDPVSGPELGGTDVLVFGQHFSNSGNLLCQFGDETIPGTYYASSVVKCTTPPGQPGKVPLTIRMDDLQLISTSIDYTYLPSAAIHSLTPESGSCSGRTIVTVEGTHFKHPSYCRFGKATVSANVLSSTKLLCSTPPTQEPGVIPFTLLNQQMEATTQEGASFEYFDEPVVERVSPATGPASGGTTIDVRGVHLNPREGMYCRFGSVVVAAKSINSDLLKCQVPPQSEDTGANPVVQVSSNGRDFTPSTTSFLYYPDPRVRSISPRKGRPHSDVTVLGQNFKNLPTLACKFGNTAKPVFALYQNDGLIICEAPENADVGNPYQTVEVTLNFADSTEDGVVFEYIE